MLLAATTVWLPGLFSHYEHNREYEQEQFRRSNLSIALGCRSGYKGAAEIRHGVYYRSRTELRRIRLAARAGCHLIGHEVPGFGPRVMCERYNFNWNLLIFIDLLKFYNCRYWSDRQG